MVLDCCDAEGNGKHIMIEKWHIYYKNAKNHLITFQKISDASTTSFVVYTIHVQYVHIKTAVLAHIQCTCTMSVLCIVSIIPPIIQ